MLPKYIIQLSGWKTGKVSDELLVLFCTIWVSLMKWLLKNFWNWIIIIVWENGNAANLPFRFLRRLISLK